MALDYDTQIELLFPRALYQDAGLAPVLEQVGILLVHCADAAVTVLAGGARPIRSKALITSAPTG